MRDFAPKLAASLNRVLVSDAVGHRVEGGRLTLVRQFFQGKINAHVHFVGEPPYFASMQAGAYRTDQAEAGSAPAVDLTAADIIDRSGAGSKRRRIFRSCRTWRMRWARS